MPRGWRWRRRGADDEVPSKFDLTLYVAERDGGIVVDLVYAADLFDAPRMRELLAQLEGVLRQAAAAPETRVGALSLATDAARAVLPDPAEPLDETWRGAVHEVFAARARETPRRAGRGGPARALDVRRAGRGDGPHRPRAGGRAAWAWATSSPSPATGAPRWSAR